MSPNKRIFLNIVATYGRSLFALACGIFSMRWVLAALGQEDFGLYGVVGGLALFIGFLNQLLSAALSRFYAVCVGASKVAENDEEALRECRNWFSTAVLLHTVVPAALMLIGYPLGEWAIRHMWIAVPVERLEACVWVFRFSCLSCLIGMIVVPYNAMYAAKQYIAELTVYGFVIAMANMFFFYYMVVHEDVWLVKYAAWMAFSSIAPNVVIACRARLLFPECRILSHEMMSWKRICQIASYAGWQTFGSLGGLFRSQGILILLNRHAEFGPMRNSSMAVANQMSAQADTLANAMQTAFQPAIANAYGARNYNQMRSLAYFNCKIGTLLSMFFAVPLALEAKSVLALWLREPPRYAAGLCWAILMAHLIDRTSNGHMLAVNASGKIAMYQAFIGGMLILSLPLAWLFVSMGLGVYSVGWALVVISAMCSLGRVWLARTLVGMSAVLWFRTAFLPLVALMMLSVGLGFVPQMIFVPSFGRIVLTVVICMSCLLVGTWFILLNDMERHLLCQKINKIIVGCAKT